MNKNNTQILVLLVCMVISGALAAGVYLVIDHIITTQYIDKIGLEGRTVSISDFCEKYNVSQAENGDLFNEYPYGPYPKFKKITQWDPY